MPESMTPLIILGVVGALFILLLSLLTNNYSLNNIKSKTVGDGQYGTARWATDQEIRKAYVTVPFDVASWRAGKKRPTVQGLILGSTQRGKRLEALVDRDDVHCLMIGASGVGKTAFFLYPNIEFACACGMSFLILDTKGDLARNCGRIAQKYYGYRVSVVDLRNPIRSDGNNLMTLVNRYMDVAREHPDDLKARATAEKYAKILAKTIVNPSGDEQDRGQNSYFYDAAEGVLATVIMTLSEFIPPDSAGHDKRHIMSVFKLVKELMAPMGKKNGFQVLIDSLPDTHKAGWMATAATSSSEQGMASVMSTVLSRLNSFIDSEQEQVLCYDSPIDAEHFASEKCAIFLIIPEEDPTKHFMAGLMIQNLSRELFSIANANEGKLKKRVVFYCDEFGTMPPFDVLPLFSAGRSRKLTLVPIIQSLAQLEKNYGKEGAEIIADNCQDTIFGGFAPNSQTAETLSKALGSRTVLTGSISKGKDSNSQSLQMAERALLSPDELKSLPKGEFVVMKTGTHPMRTKLQLYFKWGIKFEEPYQTPERAQREAEQQHWEREAQAERPFVHRQRVEDGYGVAHGIAHRREVPQNGQLQQRQAGGEHARVGRGHHMERDGVDGHGYDDGHGRVHDDGGGAVARIGGAPEQQQQGRSDARGHTGEHGGRYAQRPGQRGGEHGERARRGEDTRSEQHALGGVELEELLVGDGGEQKRQPEHHDGDEENIRYEGVRLAEEPLGRGDLEDGVRSEHGSVDPCLVYAEAQGKDI